MKPENDLFLWHTSWFSLISAIFGSLVGKYDLALVIFGVFLTSINYWRNSHVVWAKNLDMTMVAISLTYHLVYAYGSPVGNYYFIITGLGMLCYPISLWCYKQNMLWAGTIAHSGIHTLGNMACLILMTDVSQELTVPAPPYGPVAL